MEVFLLQKYSFAAYSLFLNFKMRINPCNLELYFIRKQSEVLKVSLTWREKKIKKKSDNDKQRLDIYVHLPFF